MSVEMQSQAPSPERVAASAPRRRRALLERLAPSIAAVAGLVLATWLYWGYRYGIWPQPGFLLNVLDYHGQLENDWYASLPPLHWAFAGVLSLVPSAGLDEAAFVLWLAGVALAWGAFLSICRSLGASIPAGFAAGLVAISTDFAGLGTSGIPLDYLYPTGTSFALALAAFAALLQRRAALTGAFLGAAVLVHPGLGALAAVAIGPCVLLMGGGARRLIRLGVPLLLLAMPALVQIFVDQVGGSPLPAERRFELLAEVRLPHHVLYSAFPLSEYVQTVSWLAVLGGAVVLLARGFARQAVALVASIVVGLAAAGAVASEAGGPLVIVQAYTARITPLVVAIGAAAAAAALTGRLGRWASALGLAGAFLLAPAAESEVAEPILRAVAPEHADALNTSSVSALIVLTVLGAAALLGVRLRPVGRMRALAPAAVAGALVVSGISLVAEHDDRTARKPADLLAFEDASRHAREFTRPGDVVLTPPDQDVYSFVAERPTVVTFGTFRFGQGDAAWVERMEAVTRDPLILDPALGTDAAARNAYIGQAYDRALARSPEPICRYDVRLVLARETVELPPWLSPVYRNGSYQLLGIENGTCPAQ